MASVGGVDLGSAYVNVVPSTRDFGSRLRRQILPDVAKLGVAIRKTMASAVSDGISEGADEGTDEGKKHVAKASKEYGETVEKLFAKGMADGVKGGLSKGKATAAKEGKDSGDSYGSAFGVAVQARVRRALEALPSADVNIDDADAQRRLEGIRQELESLDGQRVGVDISAGEARRKILAIQAELEALSAQDVNVQVDADVGAALAQVVALRVAADDSRNAFQRMGGSIASMIPNARNFGNLMNRSSLTMGQMATIASTLGTTLIPVAASAATIAASLAAPITAATVGLGAYGVVAGIAISQTQEQIKEITKAKEALAEQTKGTKEYREALEKVQTLTNALTPKQTQFMKAQQGLKDAFRDLQESIAPAIFDPLIQGMRILNRVMPKFKPLIRATSGALSSLLDMFDRSVRGGSLDRFIGWASRTAPPVIRTFGRIIGNAAVGVAGFFSAFQPVGFDILSWLESASRKFRAFGQSADTNPAVQAFIEYVRDVGPLVLDTLTDIGVAVAHILRAGAPIGTVLLKALDQLAELLASIPVEVLTAAWIGFTTALVSYKVAALASAAATKLATTRLLSLASVRMGALAAGVGVIAYNFSQMDSNTSGAERAMRGFTNVAAGAMAGFAVGGPWGAALGGAAGLVATFASNTESATDKFEAQQRELVNSTTAYRKFKARTEDASAQVSTLTDMLNQNTGALTKNARKMLMKDFIDEGGLALAKDAGVSLALVQKALLGNVDAMKKLKNYPLDEITTQGEAVAFDKLLNLLGVQQDNIKAARRNVKARNAMAEATKAYNKIVKKVPKKVITELSLLGPAKAAKEAKRVQKRYDLTPKQVQTLLTAADHTAKEVKSAEKRLNFVSRAREAFINAKMRNFDLTRDQALELWKQAPKSRKALIRYQSDGWKTAISQAKQVAKAVSDAADQLIGLFANAEGPIPEVRDYPGIGRAAGGIVRGPGTSTSDSIPTRLSDGEFVMRAAAVKRYGTSFMRAINGGDLGGFAAGGQAGGDVMPSGFAGSHRGFRRLWRSEIEPVLNRLIRTLRDSGSTYTPLPDTSSGDTNRGGGKTGILKGFGNGDLLEGFKKTKPILEGFQKGMKQSSKATVGMEMVVDKSSKKIGKYWTVLRKGAIQRFDKDWAQTFSRELPRRLHGFEQNTKKSVDRTGKRLRGFTTGPLKGFEKSWRTTMVTDLPKSTNTMDSKVRKTSDRTEDRLKSFGKVVRQDIPAAFRKGVDSIGKAWDRTKPKTAGPVSYILSKVLNDGLIAGINRINKFVKADKMPKVNVPGFASGGHTGPGAKYQPAGIVHAGEFVVRKEATQELQKERPGFLSRLNRSGAKALPGHAAGGFVNPDKRVYIDGEPLSAIHAAQLLLSNRLLGQRQHVMQGSWQPATSYSGTSHTGPGVADTGPGSFAAQAAQRRVAIGAWARNIPGAAYAGSGAHIHGVSLLSPGARTQGQRDDYLNGGNGLGGSDYGPRPSLLPGLSKMLRRFGPLVSSISGMGPLMPPWAAAISANPKKWARKLLDGGDRLQSSGFGQTGQSGLNTLVAPVAKWASNALSAFAGSGVPGGPMPGPASLSQASPQIAKRYAYGRLGAFGYGKNQWSALDKLWTRESNWRWNADNPTSSAYGIPQALPGSKMASAGANWLKNAGTQVNWGLGYIKNRYGNPVNAWAHSERFGWYDNGGWLKHGMLGMNTSGDPEPVLTNSQWRDVRAYLPVGANDNGGITEFVITNWEKGKGYMRRQAGAEIGLQAAHTRTLGRHWD